MKFVVFVHVKRKRSLFFLDFVVKILGFVVRCVFFFNCYDEELSVCHLKYMNLMASVHVR